MDVTVSVTVPTAPGRPGGWLPLLASLAAADALRGAAALPAEAGWPDAVLIPGAMCGGSAGSQQVGAVRVDTTEGGSAITITLSLTGAPTDTTTSVESAGGQADAEPIRRELVSHLDSRLAQWRADDPALRADYRARCQTVGRLADAEHWVSGIADDGALELTPLRPGGSR